MKPVIKYVRSEGRCVILIPTAEGLELFKKAPPTYFLETSPAKFMPLELGKERIGGEKGVDVSAYVANFKADIQHLKVESSPVSNSFTVRIHTLQGETYHIRLIYGIVPVAPAKVAEVKKEETNKTT